MARSGKGAGKGAGVAPPSTGVNDSNAYDHATEKLVAYCVNQGVDRDVAARVLAMAQRSVRDWTVSASDFLTPPESAALETAVLTIADACAVSWGGYEDAERRVLFVAHAEMVPDTDGLKQLAGKQLVLLKIMGNFEFDKGIFQQPVSFSAANKQRRHVMID